MQRPSHTRVNANPRGGFTKIELLVVVLALVAIVALIVPLIDNRRIPSRRTECLNNMKQLGLAIANYEVAHDRTLPRLYETYSGSLAKDRQYGWPFELLDYLEAGAIYEQILDTGALVDQSGKPDPAIFRPGQFLYVLTCPGHEDGYEQPGGLSYAANLGYVTSTRWGKPGVTDAVHRGIDWNGDGAITDEDVEIHRATGVFLPPGDDIRPMTIDDIVRGDGTTNTFLLLEHHHREPNWASPRFGKIAVGISVANNTFGGPPNGKLSGAFNPNGVETGEFLRLGIEDGWTLDDANTGHDARPGSRPDAPAETSWRPLATHDDAIHVVLCDKSARAINLKIDAGVYARLFTPMGSRGYGQRIDPGD